MGRNAAVGIGGPLFDDLNHVPTTSTFTLLPTMTRLRLLILLALLGCGISAPHQALSQLDPGQWKLEKVTTTTGKTYHGMVSAERDGEIEFIEVVRPRGKPMHLVVRPLATDDIGSQQRLPEDERRLLAKRIYAFRFRARIEAGRMENIEVRAMEVDRRDFLRYRGPWFTFDSTANEELTRRCIVRTEQIFRAYRQMLPPRELGEDLRPDRKLRIVLFASMDEYHTFLREHDLEVGNPAIYSQSGNTVFVGGELSRFADRQALARARHDEIRAHYDELDRTMDDRLAEIRRQLKDAGAAKKTIDSEINARKALWKSQRDEVLLQLNTADRRNDRQFNELTHAMFARLYHEALHAYLENFLYPQSKFDVPTWLHEGLAQFFQNGQLESNTLRIDAPLPSALEIAQRDMRSASPLPLLEVLMARPQDFLSEDRGRLLYAHSWALVYYLATEHGVLDAGSLDTFIARSDEESADSETAQITRFQKLVNQPLLDFEHEWRAGILGMKAGG